MILLRWARALHRNLTTFQKIVIANSAIIAFGAILGPLITLGLGGDPRLPALLLFVGLGLATSLTVNFAILRLAFRPLRDLEETMATVRSGATAARSRQDFADPDVRRIAATFNLMLERLEIERRRASARVLRAQERERERVARELHDQTGQTLTNEIIALDLMLEDGSQPDAVKVRLREVKQALESTLEEVHRMAQDLRPAVLDDLGLVPALRTLARESGAARTQVVVDAPPLKARLTPALQTALYRIAQEAVTNALKYARARQIRIALREARGVIVLEVQDDGQGFDESAISQDGRLGPGLGLFGMRERAALLGGSLKIHSAPGAGTDVTAELPLPTHA